MLSVLEEQEPELNEVNDNLSLLMQQVDEKTPHAAQVKAEVSQADQKQKELIEKLNARKINLEEDVKHARVFQGSLADIEAWLPEAEERVSAQQPISTDPETVRKQLEEAQVGWSIFRGEVSRSRLSIHLLLRYEVPLQTVGTRPPRLFSRDKMR